MFGAAEILLMQQLITNSNSMLYSSDAYNPTDQDELHPNTKVMFIELHELSGFEGDVLGTPKTINAAYIKCMETVKMKLMERGTFKETDEILECTRITMFDKDTITVSESIGTINWRLNK